MLGLLRRYRALSPDVEEPAFFGDDRGQYGVDGFGVAMRLRGECPEAGDPALLVGIVDSEIGKTRDQKASLVGQG
ncbi:MAG TPA: hypothetical protein VKQ27_03860, partial [Acetobacteraceae bacterium]|nr:hypothetical protein [Acetobacteraceae bacterium]